MPRSERAVLDVLFPEVRAKLLRSFFARPPKQRYVRELVNASGLTLHTVQDELRKLSAVGLLTSWSNGYHRFYRANRDHPMYPKLVAIVQLSETLPRAKSSALARPGLDTLRKRRSDANRGRCRPTAQRAGICSSDREKLDGFKPSSLRMRWRSLTFGGAPCNHRPEVNTLAE
jgi:predicted transcriptional regulator